LKKYEDQKKGEGVVRQKLSERDRSIPKALMALYDPSAGKWSM
jgi:hypothetical protein